MMIPIVPAGSVSPITMAMAGGVVTWTNVYTMGWCTRMASTAPGVGINITGPCATRVSGNRNRADNRVAKGPAETPNLDVIFTSGPARMGTARPSQRTRTRNLNTARPVHRTGPLVARWRQMDVAGMTRGNSRWNAKPMESLGADRTGMHAVTRQRTVWTATETAEPGDSVTRLGE